MIPLHGEDRTQEERSLPVIWVPANLNCMAPLCQEEWRGPCAPQSSGTAAEGSEDGRERLSLQGFCGREVAWLEETGEGGNDAEWGLQNSQGECKLLGFWISLLKMRIQCDLVLLWRWCNFRLLAEGVKLLAIDSDGERWCLISL